MQEDNDMSQRSTNGAEFESEARLKRRGVVAELVDFLIHNKKWWLTPVILLLVLLGVLILIGGTAAAPFIYTLF